MRLRISGGYRIDSLDSLLVEVWEKIKQQISGQGIKLLEQVGWMYIHYLIN